MAYVKIRDSEPFERAMMRFNKLCEKEGKLTEIKLRIYYEKPSVKKRREKNIAYRKQRRLQKENE